MHVKKYIPLAMLLAFLSPVLAMEERCSRKKNKNDNLDLAITSDNHDTVENRYLKLKDRYKGLYSPVDFKNLKLPLSVVCINKLLDTSGDLSDLHLTITNKKPLPKLMNMVIAIRKARYRNEKLVARLFKLQLDHSYKPSVQLLDRNLCEAALVGDEDGCSLLLAKGARLNQESIMSLVFALRGGHVAVANLLLDSLRDDLSKNNTMVELLQKQKLTSNELYYKFDDCLKRAIRLSILGTIDFLLKNGISPFFDGEHYPAETVFTDVLYKIKNNRSDGIEILKCFLPYEEPGNATVLTCLLHAFDYQDNEEDIKEVISALVASGADVNRRGHISNTPLHYAIDACLIDVVQLLLDSGANVMEIDVDNWTPLMRAKNNMKSGAGKLVDGIPSKEYKIVKIIKKQMAATALLI